MSVPLSLKFCAVEAMLYFDAIEASGAASMEPVEGFYWCLDSVECLGLVMPACAVDR